MIIDRAHDAGRIDLQLAGRSGRQGQPGSFEQIVALDDDLFRRYAPRLAALLSALPLFLWGRGRARALRAAAQARAERLHARMRREVAAQDKEADRALSFAGPPS